MSPFELVAPTTPEEAVAALRAGPPGETAVVAGGTDLLLDVEGGRTAPTRVVSLRRLPWRTLDWNGPTLTVGSMLPLRSLELDPEVRARMPGLYDAVRAVGSIALRHRATLGGNLGRSAPASDLVPVLLVLDAEVDLVGPLGARSVPVDQFVRASRATALGPHELIRSVRCPEARPSAYLWQRVRPSNDISQIAVAVAFSPSGRRWSVAVGGVPPRPVLLPEVAETLGSGRPTDAAVRRAIAGAARSVPIAADRRASEEYRRHLVGTLLDRAVRRLATRPEVPA
ncbi:MAG TPA: FAD binding domain-containing protein [Thermoplasmata archaeon]|nr:FAD binding domain-containing protein [Thermoplasmata archaeon]